MCKDKKNKEYKKLPKCPKCNSEKVIKRGFRQTENRGKLQRFSCKSCGHRFVEDEGFFRMRNDKKKITLCLDLFYKGISTRQVQSHLQQFYPHNSSHMTIYRWIVRYSRLISKFTDGIKLQVGKEMQIDEMEVGSVRSRYKGWFIDAIDSKTRFMVSSEFQKNRDLTEVKKVLWKAKNKTENQFEVITSDGWLAYPRAIQKTFVLKEKSNTRRYGVKHNVVNASKGQGFNIKIERLHNSVRHRIKTFRGFHGSVNSANAIMKGYEVFYNFIRPHLALKNKTPSELATGIKLSGNKWVSLIELAIQNNLK